jgi:hypothetical protein
MVHSSRIVAEVAKDEWRINSCSIVVDSAPLPGGATPDHPKDDCADMNTGASNSYYE